MNKTWRFPHGLLWTSTFGLRLHIYLTVYVKEAGVSTELSLQGLIARWVFRWITPVTVRSIGHSAGRSTRSTSKAPALRVRAVDNNLPCGGGTRQRWPFPVICTWGIRAALPIRGMHIRNAMATYIGSAASNDFQACTEYITPVKQKKNVIICSRQVFPSQPTTHYITHMRGCATPATP